MLKYKCIILDHDDTVVKSTQEIHYPSFVETLSILRPNLNISMQEFLLNCFDPGFFVYLEKVLNFNNEELDFQLKSWLEYINDRIPDAYAGIQEILHKFKQNNGIICVVSHSYSNIIIRDYKEHFGILPDMVFGGDDLPERRKPATYPLEVILNKFNLNKGDMVVVDDLKPGYDMASAFGVDFICAGWSHSVKKISDCMRACCKSYASNIDELHNYLFK